MTKKADRLLLLGEPGATCLTRASIEDGLFDVWIPTLGEVGLCNKIGPVECLSYDEAFAYAKKVQDDFRSKYQDTRKPCPSPVCQHERCDPEMDKHGKYRVKCLSCSMFGPRSHDKWNAVRLWNNLPRNTGWQPITEESPPMGQPVLVYFGFSGFAGIQIVSALKDEKGWVTFGPIPLQGESAPVLWRPLPQAPSLGVDLDSGANRQWTREDLRDFEVSHE